MSGSATKRNRDTTPNTSPESGDKKRFNMASTDDTLRQLMALMNQMQSDMKDMKRMFAEQLKNISDKMENQNKNWERERVNMKEIISNQEER